MTLEQQLSIRLHDIKVLPCIARNFLEEDHQLNVRLFKYSQVLIVDNRPNRDMTQRVMLLSPDNEMIPKILADKEFLNDYYSNL